MLLLFHSCAKTIRPVHTDLALQVQGIALQTKALSISPSRRPSFPFGQQSSVRNLLIFGYRKSLPSSRELALTSSMCIPSGDFRGAHPYIEAHIDGRSAAMASRAAMFIDDPNHCDE